jgi:hypothetical protein
LDDLNPSHAGWAPQVTVPKRGRAAVRTRVQDAADIDGLVVFLEERDYVAEPIGPNTIEVYRLSSVRHDHVPMELDLFLRAWRTGHPESHAEFVE